MPELSRRRFIARSAAAAAGTFAVGTGVLAPAVHVRGADAPAAAGAGGAALRWGIIGTGTRGNGSHVPAVNAADGCELVALCDVADDRLAAAAKRAGKPLATYADYQKLLADSNVNAVVIATPNLLHREQVLAALQAGKHVLCEKPIGASPADAAAIHGAADAAKTVVMFGMQYRHDPRHRKVRELIDAGRIGKPKYIVQNCSRGDWNLSPGVWEYADPKLADGKPRNWRFSYAATGGTLNEFSVHYFDLLHWYAGRLPAAVGGDGGIAVYRDGRDTWDHATVTLAYGDDLRAVHTLTFFGPSRADLVVNGDEGSIQLAGDALQVASAPRGKRGSRPPAEDVKLDAPAKVRGAADPAVLALYADFLRCATSGKSPDADVARAAAASRTCWLAERAADRRAEVKWTNGDDAM